MKKRGVIWSALMLLLFMSLKLFSTALCVCSWIVFEVGRSRGCWGPLSKTGLRYSMVAFFSLCYLVSYISGSEAPPHFLFYFRGLNGHIF